ncbi:MAG: hypothetical protein ACO2ZZ_05000 [Cyclobacteriaceae bacterium]
MLRIIASIIKKLPQIRAPGIIQSKAVGEANSCYYQYTENDAPFLFSNSDSCTSFHATNTENTLRMDVESVPDYGLQKTGKVSVLVIAGFWMLEEIAAQETLLTYQILAKPGGSIPAWVAHSAAVDTPFKSLKSLRAYLKYLQKGDRQMLIVTKLEV